MMTRYHAHCGHAHRVIERAVDCLIDAAKNGKPSWHFVKRWDDAALTSEEQRQVLTYLLRMSIKEMKR